jgi:hypothetical protein
MIIFPFIFPISKNNRQGERRRKIPFPQVKKIPLFSLLEAKKNFLWFPYNSF